MMNLGSQCECKSYQCECKHCISDSMELMMVMMQ